MGTSFIGTQALQSRQQGYANSLLAQLNETAALNAAARVQQRASQAFVADHFPVDTREPEPVLPVEYIHPARVAAQVILAVPQTETNWGAFGSPAKNNSYGTQQSGIFEKDGGGSSGGSKKTRRKKPAKKGAKVGGKARARASAKASAKKPARRSGKAIARKKAASKKT